MTTEAAENSLKIYIHAQWNEYSRTYSYFVYSVDMSKYGYDLLEVVDFPWTPPGMDILIPKTIAGLEKAKTKFRNEYFDRRASVNEKIQTLLCLEAPPMESVVDDDASF